MGATNQKINFSILTLVALLLCHSIAWASPENDRVYQLDSISWLKSTDNADGIFSDYLDEQYTQYFKNQSRFIVKPLKRLNEILGESKAKYSDLVMQTEMLKRVAVKYRVENLLRTKVFKESATYRFVIEWVYAPRGDVLASVEFRYVDSGSENGLKNSDLPRTIQTHLDELVSKLPFLGQVTGVDGETITVSVGHNQGVKPRDVLTIYTLQSVKRHPILKTIEEWRWQPIGRATIDQVEDSLSFAKVTELEPNQKVIRFQKIREIISAPPLQDATELKAKELPKLGWIAANIGAGTYAREVGMPNGSTGRTGSGLLANFEIDSQIWLNSRFIAQATLGGMIFKYLPTNLATGDVTGTSQSGSGSQFRIAAGYSLFPMRTVYDSIAWAHLGYKTTHYSLPNDSSNLTGSSSFGSLFLGLGGQVQLGRRLSAELGFDLGILRSATETDLSFGDASASTDLSFHVSGMYHLEDQVFLRLVLKLNSSGMDFPGGQSVTEKSFSISPSLMYYF